MRATKFQHIYRYEVRPLGLFLALSPVIISLISKRDSSISILRKAMNLRKDVIFAGPKFFKKKIKLKKSNKFIDYKITKNLNAACMLCEVSKLNKVGFFDEDFFLYWEDIHLMQKVNETNYKMILVNNAYALHEFSQSSEDNFKTRFIRDLNLMYGEFVYDYKVKKVRTLKIFRKLIQNLILFFFNILIFQLKDLLNNAAKLAGILKFIKFYFKKF